MRRTIIVWALLGTTGCGVAARAQSAPMLPKDGLRPEEARAQVADAKTKSDAPAVPAPVPAQPPAAPASGPASTPAPSREPNAIAPGATSEPARDPALVIYTAQLTLAVYRVEESVAAVERIAKEHGGFVARKQDREIVIRVPRARFAEAVAGVDKVGDVVHRDVSAVDVTEEHVDLEIRIKNARAMQARFKELLNRANVKESIEIEKELNRVTAELELLEGKLKVLRDRIAYSTITATFQQRAPESAMRSPRLPFTWLGEIGLPHLLVLTEEKK
jgi:hypothetical protein